MILSTKLELTEADKLHFYCAHNVELNRNGTAKFKTVRISQEVCVCGGGGGGFGVDHYITFYKIDDYHISQTKDDLHISLYMYSVFIGQISWESLRHTQIICSF